MQNSYFCTTPTLLAFCIVAVVEIEITGLPEVVENGTQVVLTCTIPRIEPPLSVLYWEFRGDVFNRGWLSWINEDGRTYTSTTSAEFT